jgi:hypothetical protein
LLLLFISYLNTRRIVDAPCLCVLHFLLDGMMIYCACNRPNRSRRVFRAAWMFYMREQINIGASHCAAAADVVVLPLRCQGSRHRHIIPTAALLPPPCCRTAHHCRPAAALRPSPLFLLSSSSSLPPHPRFCQGRRAAADALPRRYKVGWSFLRLDGWLIGRWLVPTRPTRPHQA